MKKILFKKLSGAGNDFVLIDQKENKNLELTPELVSNLCNRRTGVGADGVLEIKDVENYDFSLTYYNSDGYPGSLCGNGSRCAIKYADESGRIIKSKTKFICKDVEYKGEVIDKKNVKFFLNSPKNLKQSINISINNWLFKGDFIDSGSPHYVVDLDSSKINLETLNVVDFGEKLRYHSEFSPEGTNVNFVQVNNNEVNIRTYERGVEDETLACGTGSVASAFILFLNKKVKPPVKLNVLSGESLIVDFEYNQSKFTNISLVGPAEIVFAGEYYLI